MSAKRKTLTLSEKEKIAEDFENSNLSKARFAEERGLPRTTLNNILSSHRYGNGQRKRMRSSTYEKIEEALLQWVKIARYVPKSYSILKEKALQIASELGEPDFMASNGWIQRFKVRHDFTFKTVCGEDGDVYETVFNDWKNSGMKAAQANGTADGTSTSDGTTAASSVGHSCSSTLEKKDGTCSSSQKCGALLPSGNGEIITPDLEMQSSGETVMETQNGATPSLLNSSGIIIKQEIIETEEESCTFDDSSFHSPFIDGPLDRQRPGISNTTFDDSTLHPPFTDGPSDGHRPGTADTTHSDSSNSNCSVVTSEPALVATTSTNSSLNVEPSVSLNSCYVGSEKHCVISNLESFVRQVRVPSLSQTLTGFNHGEIYNPYYCNSQDQTTNEQIQVGVPYHAGPPSLPQTLSSSNDGKASNNNNPHSNGQSHPSVPFRQRDNFDIFGEFVASKLRSLDLKSAAYVLSAFSDLIYKVESRMLTNSNGKSLSDSQTDDSEINSSIPKEKENIQPSFPPPVSSTGSENSSRTEPNQPTVTSLNQNSCPPVSNPTIPEIITINNSNPTTISSQSNSSGPPGLNTTTTWNNTAIQPGISFQSRPSGPYLQLGVPYHTQPSIPYNARPGVLYHTQPGVPYNTQPGVPYNTQPGVPYNTQPGVPYNTQPGVQYNTQPSVPPCCMRPKDRFDNFGEFVASKLRILDSKSRVFVETAFADLIFKAELGKFTCEKSFLANRTNDFQQNKLGSNASSSQTNVSMTGGYVIQPQVNLIPQNYGVGQVPFVNVLPNHVAVTNNS